MKFPTHIILVISIFTSLFSQKESKLEINKLTDQFYIFTTYNTFKGVKYPANGMYILTKKGAILIDTPWDSSQYQPLLDSIYIKHQKKVLMVLGTHSHDDRILGLDYYKSKGIDTYTSKLTDQVSIKKQNPRAEFIFKNDTNFTFPDLTFQTFYGGHAHSIDNIVIWFPKEKILFG